MKNTISIFTLLIAIGALGFSITNNVKSKKIGYVYNAKLISEFNGTKQAQAEYQHKISSWQQNLDTLESDLKRELQLFQAEKSAMSSQEGAQREQYLQQRTREILGYKQSIENKAVEEEAEMTQGLLKQIDAFLIEYGKNSGYDFILGVTENGSILYAEESDDLTDEVIEALNSMFEGE